MSEAFERARNGLMQVGEQRREYRANQAERATNQAAGNALQAGDYGAASSALFAGGNLQGGMAVQNAGRGAQTADRDQQRSAIAAAVTGLLHVPEAERGVMLQSRIAPLFKQLGMGEYLSQITPQDLTDGSLRGLAASMGGEVETGSYMNAGNGRIVQTRPYGAGVDEVYAAPQAGPTPPAGYRYTPDGSLEAIPGGPADPRVIGSRAAAGRAPPRFRSGGGGRSGGGAAPRVPASRPPWERF